MCANGFLIISCQDETNGVIDEGETKRIFFSNKKNMPEVNISYYNNRMRHFHIVQYHGCCLDANLSGRSMTTKSLKKVNTKLKFLYR